MTASTTPPQLATFRLTMLPNGPRVAAGPAIHQAHGVVGTRPPKSGRR
ncbi:MAG TPA: hypothetical protein VIV12_20910 [Streptosporangiaceae bacterium]